MIVPTVERGFRLADFWSIETAGDSPSMKSTSGLSICEELPGVGGQRLDVPALALGEDRVEGQAGLTRTGQPGEHDHRTPRQVQRDVLEVVLTRTANHKTISHCASLTGLWKRVHRSLGDGSRGV